MKAFLCLILSTLLLASGCSHHVDPIAQVLHISYEWDCLDSTATAVSGGTVIAINAYTFVTAKHLLCDAGSNPILFIGDQKVAAIVTKVSADPLDIITGVISVPLFTSPFATFAVARIGEPTRAFGFGLHGIVGYALTDGVVTAISPDLLYSTANLFPGMSGGPLVNMRGEVIGMNDMTLGDNYNGLPIYGFVPASALRAFIGINP